MCQARRGLYIGRPHELCTASDGMGYWPLHTSHERGTERMSEGSGRQEMERRLIEKSLQDEDFRQRLIEDPKGAVEQELGTRLPEGVRVEAVEETADTIYLVLPSASPIGEGDELSDRDLEAVAGAGWGTDTVNDNTCNAANTCYIVCGVNDPM